MVIFLSYFCIFVYFEVIFFLEILSVDLNKLNIFIKNYFFKDKINKKNFFLNL